MRRVEPEPVFLERPTEAAPHVIDLLHLLRLHQAPGAQLVRQIVRLQLRASVGAHEHPAEDVAALFGHHVQLNAAALDLGGHAAGLQDDLLGAELIDHVDAV